MFHVLWVVYLKKEEWRGIFHLLHPVALNLPWNSSENSFPITYTLTYIKLNVIRIT